MIIKFKTLNFTQTNEKYMHKCSLENIFTQKKTAHKTKTMSFYPRNA